VAGSAPDRRLLTRGEAVGSRHYVRLDQLFVTLDITDLLAQSGRRPPTELLDLARRSGADQA
jgi:hypothetical protein